MSPSSRALQARVRAHKSWANTSDRSGRTAKARAAFDVKFEDQVDPDRVLPESERALRAAHARKAYFLELALKSAKARRRPGKSGAAAA